MATGQKSQIGLARAAGRLAEIDKAKRREAAGASSAGKGPVADTVRQERNRQEREIALRMVRRFFPVLRDGTGGPPDPIAMLYAYWQARRCGWDALQPTMMRDRNGAATAPPESWVWRWWMGLHCRQRRMMARISVHRVYSSVKLTPGRQSQPEKTGSKPA